VLAKLVQRALQRLISADEAVDAAPMRVEPSMRAVRLPWSGTADEALHNLALGNLHASMLQWLKDEAGVHAETLMVAIGALAGFAGQNAALVRIEKRDVPLPPGAGATIALP